ncbi:tRNA(Ile)-lysidine synthase, partial [termite gut metagenome]
MFHRQIAAFIEKERLLPLAGKVLVALSGGADSVALLRVLLSLGYDCEAAHCNFRLR